MLHKSQKQKLLLTNANILLKQSSFSTINDEAKPVRVNRKYKTQSYSNLYDEIFKKKQNAFSNKNIFVNNKYNMLYAENEKQYELKMTKMKMTQKQRREKSYQGVANKLNGMKKDVLFVRRIVDYVYPTLLTKKLSIQTQKSQKRTVLPLVTSYHGVNRKMKEDNDHLTDYLYHSITITK